VFSGLASRNALLLVVGFYFQSLTQSRCLATALPIPVVSLKALMLSWRQKRGEITMFTETINKTHAGNKGTRGHHLLSLFIALVFAITIYPTKAHAQITGALEVNIPFAFHAGNAKLPPGKYIIHPFDDSNLTVMEISSADGSTSALFQVQESDANSAPAKSELIFNKYGNRYFLAKLFDEGNPSGSQVAESPYEKKISQAAEEAQAHVPAHHRGQQGK
jgi:hypothetical protein